MKTNNETLSWKEAAIAWGEGKQVQSKSNGEWWDLDLKEGFWVQEHISYRLKPLPAAQEEKKENPYGFKCDGMTWYILRKGCEPMGVGTVADHLNRLHQENEALKNRFDNEVESYKKEIIRIETELSRARDTIYVMTHGSNDKQLTPTQTTPNIPKEIKEEYEFCKSILSTKSPVCPEVPRASNDKTDNTLPDSPELLPSIYEIVKRLEKVEKDFAFFIKNQQMANNPYFNS